MPAEPCPTCGGLDACRCCENCGAPDARGAFGHCSRCAPYFDPLSIDRGRSAQMCPCSDCEASCILVKAFIVRGSSPVGVYLAALHRHDGQAEAWIDVILGTFGAGEDSDHVTFGCRVGPVAGEPGPVAGLVPAAATYPDEAVWGDKLSPAEAVGHARIWEFWEVVEHVLVEDPDIRGHLYGDGPAPRHLRAVL
jgi:hypothetical protein